MTKSAILPPDTPPQPPGLRGALASFAVVFVGYAAGVAAVAVSLPAILTPLPLSDLAPHVREVARSPLPEMAP